MLLLRELSYKGKTIVLVTHTLDNIDLCDSVALVMDGRLAFFGPAAEAKAHFEIEHMVNLYTRLKEKSGEAWSADFAPPEVLLDEPTSGLDPGLEEALMLLLRELSYKGKTIVLVTHTLEHIELCDAVALVMDGRLAFFGSAAEARARQLGLKTLRLCTGEKNTRQVRWYHRHGYAIERVEELDDRRIVHMTKTIG